MRERGEVDVKCAEVCRSVYRQGMALEALFYAVYVVSDHKIREKVMLP